jgi:hypothetical protein
MAGFWMHYRFAREFGYGRLAAFMIAAHQGKPKKKGPTDDT